MWWDGLGMQDAMNKWQAQNCIQKPEIKWSFGGQGTNVRIIVKFKDTVSEKVIWINLIQVRVLWARREYGNETSGSLNDGKYLRWMRHYYYEYLLKNENICSIMYKRWN
jgi:hypothetical protein